MNTRFLPALLFLVGVLGPLAPATAAQPGVRKISRAALEDKIRGGWAGQMFGVAYGAPVEFRSLGKIFEGEIKWSPEMVSNAIVQDDLYVEMTFTEVLDRVGLNATSADFGDAFAKSKYHLWHANAAARRLLNLGIRPPMSGHPRFNYHSNDIDFQIESDFIGLMTPGLPRVANRYADRVGHVMNYGDGVYGGMFFAGMYSAAFFDSDPRRVVEEGLKSLPPKSGYAMIIRDVLDWSATNPSDWKATWALIQEKWDRDDVDPDGSLSPFNIDARLNGAYVALGLLYGGGDFDRTIEITTRAGQDADCNPSSAAGILGVIKGFEATPQRWKSGIAAIADKKFEFTEYSFESITASTLRRALRLIEMNGGKVSGKELLIPVQAPVPAKLESFDPGIPEKSVRFDSSEWRWKGDWKPGERGNSTTDPGGEAVFSFNGVGCMLIGPLSQEGGRADVFVDGRRQATGIDAFTPERTWDNALWRVYGLRDGPHTVRIVARPAATGRSPGARLTLERVVVFRRSGK